MIQEKWIPKPSQSSPEVTSGILGWLRTNLFSNWANTLLTVLGLVILYLMIPPFIRWVLIDATWFGSSRDVCDAAAADGSVGACWTFINVRMGVFIYGFYPELERWRINLALLLLAFNLIPILASSIFRGASAQGVLGAVGTAVVWLLYGGWPAGVMGIYFFAPMMLAVISQRYSLVAPPGAAGQALAVRGLGSLAVGVVVYWAVKILISGDIAAASGILGFLLALGLLFIRRLAGIGWRWLLLFTVYPVCCFYLLVGGVLDLPHVETHYWGGLFLTLVVAGTGMGSALPIGIALALGRRSDLPIIKTLCIAFIEFVRGVPLVSVLFMASVMFPLFLPENVTFDKLLRALVGVAFFYAAYMAEVVRGGLQAIPKGQYEAAKALGWPYWRMMSVIILPQTLRLVIPGLANNFLSLLKDTTLVAVIGLLDLLGIAKAAMADSEWLGFTKEAYVFAAIVFWVICFAISRYSVHLEKKYHTSYH